MKRILIRLSMVVVFLLLLGFAIKNMDGVVLRYFLGFEWHVPLAFVLLLFFALGTAGGMLANVAIIMRQRRELAALKRQLRSAVRVPLAPVVTAESQYPGV